LINQIITKLKLPLKSANQTTPALSTKILQWNEKVPDFDQCFHYRRIVGQLNFLKKSTRPYIAYATHQVARFCQDPKATHAEAIKHITKYLCNMSHEGITLCPKTDKSFDIFADADFVRNWHRMTASDDPSTTKSRSGYVILYARCPIAWCSKLQTIIALSSCEAKYVALSESLATRCHPSHEPYQRIQGSQIFSHEFSNKSILQGLWR
jgi:hypothetical protein